MTKEAIMESQSVKVSAPLRRVRRIVTGENAHGKSVFTADGPAPNHIGFPGTPAAHVVWVTGEAAAAGPDPAPEGHGFDFHSRGGSLLRVVDFPPDEKYDKSRLTELLDEAGVREEGRHFWFHKTQSLDYAIVLDGEIYAMMDEGETLMRAGDILIQRATNHSWSNRSGKTCRMAFVLLDLVPGPTA